MKRVPLNRRRKVRRIPPPSSQSRQGHTDSELREAARLLSILRAGGDVRGPVVDRIRDSVEHAVYENELKLTVAVDRIADEL